MGTPTVEKLKLMKYILISIILINFCFGSSSGQSLDNHNEGNCLLGMSVELYLNTSSSVPCDLFATKFKSTLKINCVFDKDSIKTFLTFLKHIKYVKRNKKLDTRAKFLLTVNGKDFVACTDGRNILIDDRLIKKNKKFIKFLYSIVDWP